MSLEFGRTELEHRPRAERHLRKVAGVTRTVAGAPRRAHAPEPAPRGTLNLGVKSNTLTDREFLLKLELKTTFWTSSSFRKKRFLPKECDVRVMLGELREACRRIRKPNMAWTIVATHRLEKMNHLGR